MLEHAQSIACRLWIRLTCDVPVIDYRAYVSSSIIYMIYGTVVYVVLVSQASTFDHWSVTVAMRKSSPILHAKQGAYLRICMFAGFYGTCWVIISTNLFCSYSQWENSEVLWCSHDGGWSVVTKWQRLALRCRRIRKNTPPCSFPQGRSSIDTRKHSMCKEASESCSSL